MVVSITSRQRARHLEYLVLVATNVASSPFISHKEELLLLEVERRIIAIIFSLNPSVNWQNRFQVSTGFHWFPGFRELYNLKPGNLTIYISCSHTTIDTWESEARCECLYIPEINARTINKYLAKMNHNQILANGPCAFLGI